MTIRLVEEMLKEESLVAGIPTKDWKAFVKWNSTPEESIHRINLEWDKLGREPNVWELVWFAHKSKIIE